MCFASQVIIHLQTKIANNEPERAWRNDIWVWDFSPRMLQIIDVIHTFHMGHPQRTCPENRGIIVCSRLILASSIGTVLISLKLLQNCEILTIIRRFTKSSYWLISRFLTTFIMTFWTQCSYFRDITPCNPLTIQLTWLSRLLSCSAYSTLKMEAICSSETSVDFHRATRRYIP
jgi:hypothetical protein